MTQLEGSEFEKARAVIAARIRELRLEKGLSQEKLADLAGCDRTYVGMLEQKLGNPSLRVLVGIARALQVPLNALFVHGRSQSDKAE